MRAARVPLRKKKRGAMCVLRCREGRGRRERRMCPCVRSESFLRDYPVYQKAVGACASGCAGVGGWWRCARMCVEAARWKLPVASSGV